MLKLRVGDAQHEEELRSFVEYAQKQGVRRYLEIGSRWGDSFWSVMSNLEVPSLGMFIDISESQEKAIALKQTVLDLRAMGHQVIAGFNRSSHNPVSWRMARRHAPFDLVLIDADHTYESVQNDWDSYGRLSRVVAFHDVAAPDGWTSGGKPNEVGRLWREIKSCAIGEFTEFIVPSDRPMGYGIVTQGA